MKILTAQHLQSRTAEPCNLAACAIAANTLSLGLRQTPCDASILCPIDRGLRPRSRYQRPDVTRQMGPVRSISIRHFTTMDKGMHTRTLENEGVRTEKIPKAPARRTQELALTWIPTCILKARLPPYRMPSTPIGYMIRKAKSIIKPWTLNRSNWPEFCDILSRMPVLILSLLVVRVLPNNCSTVVSNLSTTC
jgi:hypothetical protein